MPFSQNPRKNIAYEIRGTFRAFENELIQFLGTTGISVASFHVLRLQWSQDGFLQKDVARLAFMTPSVASQLIQKMEMDGILSRKQSSENSVAKQVFLTEKGFELRASIIDGAQAIAERSCLGLSDEDILHLIKILSTIRTNLEMNPDK